MGFSLVLAPPLHCIEDCREGCDLEAVPYLLKVSLELTSFVRPEVILRPGNGAMSEIKFFNDVVPFFSLGTLSHNVRVNSQVKIIASCLLLIFDCLFGPVRSTKTRLNRSVAFPSFILKGGRCVLALNASCKAFNRPSV